MRIIHKQILFNLLLMEVNQFKAKQIKKFLI